MHLNQFPKAIHQSQRKLLKTAQTVRRLQENLDSLTAQVDYSIAFDAELKNDAQRKARRAVLCETPEYIEAVTLLYTAKDKQAELETDHQLLLNQFTVAKLQIREAIASKEALLEVA